MNLQKCRFKSNVQAHHKWQMCLCGCMYSYVSPVTSLATPVPHQLNPVAKFWLTNARARKRWHAPTRWRNHFLVVVFVRCNRKSRLIDRYTRPIDDPECTPTRFEPRNNSGTACRRRSSACIRRASIYLVLLWPSHYVPRWMLLLDTSDFKWPLLSSNSISAHLLLSDRCKKV
jgi:hypothetical protein